MNPTSQSPPVGEWWRLSRGAATLGISPKLLLSTVATRSDVRVARIGPGQLVHVSSVDIQHLAETLARGVAL